MTKAPNRSPSPSFDVMEADLAAPLVEENAPLRILVASHSHPEISKGGAEIAAFQLYRGYESRSDCAAWFLGCDRRSARSEMPITQPFGGNDYLYSVGEFDWFKFSNRDPRLPEALTNLLLELRPDIVHFHHYINLGVEVFALVKRVLPGAKIVVTLHEYLAICNHHGQMVTNPHRYLCYQANPVRCIECFPQFAESDFFLRNRYIGHFFAFVDHFVSPSSFLADRYISWGISESRISVIENLIRPPRGSIRPVGVSGPLRAGFFGQLSFLKGANVLFDAADLLAMEERFDISIEIFGDFRSQPPEFQKELQERMEKLGQNVVLHGPYDESRVDMLMQSVDVTIVPSVWWENSPMVIQEALRNGRPVICSDIGGMAEKVRDGIDGFHFHAGSAGALALLLKRIAADRQLLTNVTGTIGKVTPVDVIIETHLSLYRTLQDRLAQNRKAT
jgi:glycosyltransferase involved in cell wall biosynthesis